MRAAQLIIPTLAIILLGYSGSSKAADISNGNIKPGAVTFKKIKSGSIGSNHILTSVIKSKHIKPGIINGTHIGEGSIQPKHLQGNFLRMLLKRISALEQKVKTLETKR